jgi:hypothetical protein
MNALFNSSKVFFLFLYNIKYKKIWSEKYMNNSEYRVNKKKLNKDVSEKGDVISLDPNLINSFYQLN